MSKRVAVVTGSNKGIGYAIVKRLCKEFDGVVYLTARNVENGHKAIESLKALGLTASFHQLDIESQESVNKFRDYLKDHYGSIDVLVNNAAVFIPVNAENTAGNVARETMDINYYATMRVSNALFPLLRSNARVVNVASKLGLLCRVPNQELKSKILKAITFEEMNQISEGYVKSCFNGTFKEDGYPTTAYEMSKVALIAITRFYQKLIKEDSSRSGIIINAVCPGYCATDLNNNSGYLTADQGAETPTFLTQIGLDETNGGEFWSEKSKVDWENEVFDYVLTDFQ